MTDFVATENSDEASVLAQTVRRNYIEELVEKAKLMESRFGADYPREISKAFQDLAAKKDPT